MPRRPPQYRPTVGRGLGKPLHQALLFSLAWGLMGPSGHAQVAPGGLGTRVNGTALGRCSQGVCSVQGGTPLGGTLFHRFSQFDTRGGIQRVDLDTAGNRNVVVGVSHPAGSFFSAPLRLSQAASLFWLSPGGIWLGGGGTILGASNLLLSTAPTLRIGAGEFKAAAGLRDGLGPLIDPANFSLQALPQGGLQGAELGAGDGPIVLAGGRLQVDRQLLLDSGAGPIRTLPGTRSDLRAGADVRLSGGDLLLRGLEVQAGSAVADGGVSLQAGAVPGVSQGRLELADAQLRGPRIGLEGATTRLDTVRLEGGDLLLRSSGPLNATHLRARAEGAAGGGRLELTAGPAPAGGSSLRLDRSELEGQAVVIRAQGPIELRQVQARAAAAGEAGGVWLSSQPGPGGTASPIALERVGLQGENLVVQAAGDLRSQDLQANAKALSFEAQNPNGSPGDLSLRGGELAAGRIALGAAGQLSLRDVRAEAETLRLGAAQRLAIDDSSLAATGEKGRIQIDALAAPGAPPQGSLELRSSRLLGQAIVARADQSIHLQEVAMVAGVPGQRGLIQLETAPVAEPPEGPGSGGSGETKLIASRLEGLRVQLRSGTIRLAESTVLAPKGMIHLEAKAADLDVTASNLDVGAHSAADLRTPVNRRDEVAGVILSEALDPPSVGLFAAANLRIRDGSQISASQDVEALRRTNPSLSRNDIRLTDTSGNVVLDAGQGLTIRDSRITADASHNLAGNVLLRSQTTRGEEGLTLSNATLSASGGAGSGDIRLSSANGIVVEGSRLLAQSDKVAADLARSSEPDWRTTFSAGEITLTNSASQRGIKIVDSQLLAEQSGRAGTLSPEVLDGRGEGLAFPLLFRDNYDANDFGVSSLGGIVNLITAGGLSLNGDATRISVDSGSPPSGPPESFGGTIRIVNFAAAPIAIQASGQLSTRTGPPPSPDTPARPGELLIHDPASIPVSEAFAWGAGRDPNPYLLQPGAELQDQLFTGGETFDTPGGLPGEIRRRVQQAPADLVFVPGEQPREVPPADPLARSNPADRITAGAAAPAPPPLANGALIPMAAPPLSSARFSPMTSLAFATPSWGLGGASLQVESLQAMPEAEARRLFQLADQDAARAVTASLGLRPTTPQSLEIAELQQQLRAGGRSSAAIVQISRTPLPGSSLVQLNHVLIPSTGDIRGWQTRTDGKTLQQAIAAFQRQLSQQAPIKGPVAGEQLSELLLKPILPDLRRLGVKSLLLALDRGLQGIPFAALPVEGGMLVDRMAFTITPALSLTKLTPPARPPAPQRTLLAGASRFANGLAPLPMASQELRQLAALHPDALVLLDEQFNTRAVLEQTRSHPVEILHLATHADFPLQRADAARIYTSDGELSLKDLGRELNRHGRFPLTLFVLNACRTAVGDEQRELGIAGLALQAGAGSALGNLWYVDDVVTAAFSVQFHRTLQQGLSSDEALKLTQSLFRNGAIQVQGDKILTTGGAILLSGLSRADQARLAPSLDHPYYWAGAILSGRPW